MVTILATLNKVQIDSEGEAKITFTVPLSSRNEVLALSMLTETVLKLNIAEEGGN